MSGIKIGGDPWASGDPPSASAKRSWLNKNWWDTSSAKGHWNKGWPSAKLRCFR